MTINHPLQYDHADNAGIPSLVWTIGHSTRSLDEFIALLNSFGIQVLVDVRNFPGSRKFPHFNKEALEASLPAHSIRYVHIKGLGGRRKGNPDSLNTGWRSLAFRAYADYMETPEFKEGVDELIGLANNYRTAYMCSEAVWWRCHRSLISDYLKVRGWRVMHITAIGKATEHPFTQPAKIINGILTYRDE
jgi:uncharacterized protein (DUF488 family)